MKEKAFINKVFDCNSGFLNFHKKKLKFLKKMVNNIKYQIENAEKKSN